MLRVCCMNFQKSLNCSALKKPFLALFSKFSSFFRPFSKFTSCGHIFRGSNFSKKVRPKKAFSRPLFQNLVLFPPFSSCSPDFRPFIRDPPFGQTLQIDDKRSFAEISFAAVVSRRDASYTTCMSPSQEVQIYVASRFRSVVSDLPVGVNRTTSGKRTRSSAFDADLKAIHMRYSSAMSTRYCRTGERQPEHCSIRATFEVCGSHNSRCVVLSGHAHDM